MTARSAIRYAHNGDAAIAYIAARIQADADPGQVLVSSTVKDLVVGSGLRFVDRGERALKGVPDTWRLFVVTADEESQPAQL